MGNSQYKKDEAVAYIDSFFVRLVSPKLIYFTETEKDTVVIGSLEAKSVKPIENPDLGACFNVFNQ